MWNIAKRQFTEQRNSVLIYLASLFGYTLLMVSMFPTLKKMDIESLIQNYPKEIADFFSQSGMSSYSKIEGFLSMEFLSFFFILVIAFYIGSAAGSAIAGQIEKKTMDFNLSQPVSRTKIVLANAIVALLYSALIVNFTSFAIWFCCQAYNIEISTKGIAAFALFATVFIWSIYGIGVFFSSILRSKIGVSLLTVGITLASFIILSLTRIVDKLKDLENISIFKLYDPEKLLANGQINLQHILILLSIMILGLAGSLIIFNKKDV